ncbi:hypothetical protein [Devosia sp.]|uniref:hypothetical protein n=1 Tax=Devosia sp. TaxID=1871048 RepID=UPI0035AFAF0A
MWLDLAKDFRNLPFRTRLGDLVERDEVELLVPEVVREEFARNRARVLASARRAREKSSSMPATRCASSATKNERPWRCASWMTLPIVLPLTARPRTNPCSSSRSCLRGRSRSSRASSRVSAPPTGALTGGRRSMAARTARRMPS